jgi:acylphosphatase
MAKHIIVKGRVQGVFFRKHTQQKAYELNITGWVRNTDDDRVEIFAQGEEHNLREFIEWCKVGPARAEVEDLEITDENNDGSLRRFSVVY